MKKTGIISLIFCIVIACTYDPTTISGTVTDKTSGIPVSNVQIVIRGTNDKTQTDSQGNYELISYASLDYTIVYIHEDHDTLRVHACEMSPGEHYRIDVALE